MTDDYRILNRANWDERARARRIARIRRGPVRRRAGIPQRCGPVRPAAARRLAEKTSTPVNFVESDVYDAVSALGTAQFDLVFTGIGALCRIPSIDRWAQTVADLLRPGGRLFLREGHPMLTVSSDLQAVASEGAIDETRTDRLSAIRTSKWLSPWCFRMERLMSRPIMGSANW